MSDPKAPLDSGGSKVGWIRQNAVDRAAQDGADEESAIDMNENEVHAGTGQVCPVCHRAIAGDELVRLQVDGTYQHDTCPPS